MYERRTLQKCVEAAGGVIPAGFCYGDLKMWLAAGMGASAQHRDPKRIVTGEVPVSVLLITGSAASAGLEASELGRLPAGPNLALNVMRNVMRARQGIFFTGLGSSPNTLAAVPPRMLRRPASLRNGRS
jgi:hypothetical protein